MEGDMITFEVSKETLEKIFLGIPGQRFEMPMTSAFQRLMEEQLGVIDLSKLTVTFEERDGSVTIGNPIIATFETKQA